MNRILEIASKEVISFKEYFEILDWYKENNRFSWFGSVGIDGKGQKYQLITDYNLTNERVYEFYLEDEHYREMNK